MKARLLRLVRWLVGPLRLAVAAVLVSLALVAGPTAAGATSPLWSIWYPSPAASCGNELGGLSSCLNPAYQVSGSGLFVQLFFRQVWDQNVINATVVTRMCGPTFGCAWVGHAMQPGQVLNLDIPEWQNMPAGTYTSQFYLPGYPVVGASFAVHA